MKPQSVFYEEWLRSLREQYKHVLRKNDKRTLSSLTAVMNNVGFRAEELAQLRFEATMHIDDLGADDSVDMSSLSQPQTADLPPAVTDRPANMSNDEKPTAEASQPTAPAAAASDEDSAGAFPVADFSEKEDRTETEPVTFEDSVAADALQTEATEDDAASDEDDAEPDPDAPAQMNLF